MVLRCKDCKRRHLACHDYCENYLEFKERNEKIRKAREAERLNKIEAERDRAYANRLVRERGI